MHLTIPALTTLLLATTTAAISTTATYKLAIGSRNPSLSNTTVVLKDDSAPASSPNALGIYSSGAPRSPYTFTIATNSSADNLYEFRGAVRKTHLIVNGDARAMGLFDVAIGADPVPVSKAEETRSLFLIDPANPTSVRVAASMRGGAGHFDSAGSWRACTSGTVDYQLYWYDGQSALQDIISGCESVTLQLVEVSSSSSTSATVPANPSASGFITGVGAPSQTPTASGWISGVPAPSGNATRTGAPSPSQFPGAAPRVGMAGALMSLAVGAGAVLLF